MTIDATRGLERLTGRVLELGDRLTERDWMAPSACPGWSVHDILIHLTCTFRQVAAPDTLPAPVPGSIERTNDAEVVAFRHQSPMQTLEDYEQLVPAALDQLAAMQHEPQASETIDFEDAGIYASHLVADSLVFDHYCHLRHDIGGLARTEFDPSETTYINRATLEWLMAGLPQMSSKQLATALRAPVELELEGPGGGHWALRRTEDTVEVVSPQEEAGARVTSKVDDFLLWGTHRRHWQECPVELHGDRRLAVDVLNALRVF